MVLSLEQILKQAAEASTDPMMVLSSTRNISYMNGAAAREMNLSMRGSDQKNLFSAEEWARFDSMAQGSIHRAEWSKRDKFYLMKAIKIADPTNPSGYHLKIEFSNPDQVQKELIRLQTAAYIDSLTGLFNRRYMNEKGEERYRSSMQKDKHCTVFVMDADGFKRINDQYGHEKGDVVIAGLASVIKAELRRNAIEYAVRLGGDEFVGIMDYNFEEALAKTQVIRKKIQESVFFEGQPSITISAGIVSTGRLGQKPSDLSRMVHYADLGLLKAKDEGKNRTVEYSP
jgi:diguanylate cyclase (GGDEF)-like protein